MVQENHYDPWGLNLAGIETKGNPNHEFQYNGKEKQEEFGLNWMDYGARQYDPQLGRWHVNDSKADKYASVTTYVYCANNPMRFIDPDGNDIYDPQGNKVLINYENGQIKSISGTSDAKFIQLLNNTYSHSDIGKNAIIDMSSSAMNYYINLHEERGAFKTDQGKFNEVNGLSIADNDNAIIDIYANGAESLGSITAKDIPSFEILDSEGKEVKIGPKQVQKFVSEINNNVGKKESSLDQGAASGLTADESATYDEASTADKNNKELRSTHTLIYEYSNIKGRLNYSNTNKVSRDSDSAMQAGETTGRKAVAEAYKQYKNK
ncbi:RHS repeat-associated core domain-containing protein [Cytophagaceae bacterium BD1B2-1]|uniref:RHS repeat-associated core domain-containing protein n=1 Tax=Xanthocytophaga agilis TaxID=3048010 RepID=A0AAE3UH83_9BACT|nr:RHS repeat-associated core domain-containing protein [Xanthocytophaga agilis]